MYTNFKKSLGQNFLKDEHYIQKIVDCVHYDDISNFLEIGPGDGQLSEKIIQLSQPIKLIEIDQNLNQILNSRFSKYKNVDVINDDVLKLDLKLLSNSNTIILGNLPYNISSQIIFKVLESNIEYKYAIFLIQKELADRFIPKENKSTKLSLQSNYFADLEKIFDIPPDAFYPVPKVNSTLVKITPNRKKYNLSEYNKLKTILSACFANPRKQLASPLKKIFPSMPSFSFSLTNRPEDLALDHYFEILSKYEK